MNRSLPALLLSFLCATAIHAAKLGDPAQPLEIQEWVKGGPVDLSQGKGKTIYVVEFWATWCPPCRTSIPHLTEMQKKFKDKGVVFIGVTDEKSDVVKKFVEKMGDKMEYVVAIDTGKTSAGYMQAYGIGGIPHAFIVNKEGNVVWQGHPMDGLEQTLEAVISGTYDVTKAAAKAGQRAEIQQKLQAYVKLVMSGDEGEATKKLEAELVALEKEVGGILEGEKFDPADVRQRIKFSQQMQQYQQLVMRGGDTNEIAKLEKGIEATAPKDFDFAAFKARFKQTAERSAAVQKSKTLVDDYFAAVGKDGDPAKAAALATKIEALGTNDAQMLNDIAWTILTDDAVQTRDLKLALKIAQRANDATGGKEAGVLDTYARALFDNGQVGEAITQETRAVALAEDDDTRTELKKSLEKYEAQAKATPKASAR